MTQTHILDPATAERTKTARPTWPLVGTAAGLLGYVATLALDGRTTGSDDIAISEKLFTDLSPVVYRLSMITGYIVVALLLVFAANWRRRIEPRVPGSTAAHLVPLGLVASAAGLTYGYGWKGALGNYMPGGMEEGLYDTQGLYVYYLLNDFGAFIGWLGVIVAAGAVIWMSLRERTVARWIGLFSILPVLVATAGVAAGGVPGIPGMVAPLWLIVTGLGLTFGRSTITR
jgi:hypothetical protein